MMKVVMAQTNQQQTSNDFIKAWEANKARYEQSMEERRQQGQAIGILLADILRYEYGCKKVVGIGSTYNLNARYNPDSDIDLVVWNLSGYELFQAELELENLGGYSVNLIPFETANEEIKMEVDAQGIPL